MAASALYNELVAADVKRRRTPAGSDVPRAHVQQPPSPDPEETTADEPAPAPAPVAPLEAKDVLAAAARFP
ncbi:MULTISPECIES: hypothetical protein [Streptomyces]|uniref:hypothetical protein n=1 Tax=Streptomyces TaxID=1883 RepID=UPI001675B91A|nr:MULTISPECIES: hypothetical protein [Streptomyces]MBD3580533.1 hypothetical protein [Streptomyces sp. KD18]GGT30228.1 hypothetical protein GCM10010286_64210 [Streptomyces toxytricini]